MTKYLPASGGLAGISQSDMTGLRPWGYSRSSRLNPMFYPSLVHARICQPLTVVGVDYSPWEPDALNRFISFKLANS